MSSSPIPSPPPDASATVRGLVTTGTQTLAGAKTFSGSVATDTYKEASGTTRLAFSSGRHTFTAGVTDGGSAIAFVFNNSAALANAGAKIASFQENSVERWRVMGTGSLQNLDLAGISPLYPHGTAFDIDMVELSGIRVGTASFDGYNGGWRFSNGCGIDSLGFSLSSGNSHLNSVGLEALSGSHEVRIEQRQAISNRIISANTGAAAVANTIGTRDDEATVDATAELLRVSAGIFGTETPHLSVLKGETRIHGNATLVVGYGGVGTIQTASTGSIATYDLSASNTLQLTGSDTTGTPGSAVGGTICGRAAIAAGAATMTITNGNAAAGDVVIVTADAKDVTAGNIYGVAGSGTITVTCDVNATADFDFSWLLIKRT